MRVMEWDEFLDKGLPVKNGFGAVSVGVFDGVHRGHRVLVERIVNYDRRALPAIVTFRQNHKNRGHYPGDISSFRQKLKLFESLGVAVTVAVDLSDSFRRMPGREFFRLLRERGKMGFLAVGSNFRCGYNQDTDASLIRQINSGENIPTDIVETLVFEGEPVSSSRIRRAVSEGKLREAAAMLGRPFCFDAEAAAFVSDGDSEKTVACDTRGLGRVLPPSGIYAALLTGKNGRSKQAEIHIREKSIFLPAFSGLEYVEFINRG